MTALAGWENFYVIVGSSAGALIGLQFVVMALISDMPHVPGREQAGAAFATPNIVHFGSVLLLSAILTAPWPTVYGPIICLSLMGLGGVVYEAIVTWRMHAQTLYRPQAEDWWFHSVLPLAGYAALAASGFAACGHARGAMFGVAAAALTLLFAGIHNAWDAVTYHVFTKGHTPEQPK